MKKLSTLFKKDPTDLSRVTDEVDPQNEWAILHGNATQKFDGTAASVINGVLYKRYDVKKGRSVPVGAIPCQEPDLITGHWPHWVACTKEDKYFLEAWERLIDKEDGTYELCGPKVQGNPEKFPHHILIKHGSIKIWLDYPLSFEGIKRQLEKQDIEGVVFHHPDGRMCKIRKSDFGLVRNPFTL